MFSRERLHFCHVGVDFLFGFVFSDAVTFLDLTYEHVFFPAATSRSSSVSLPHFVFTLPFGLLPISFDNIPVHNFVWLGFCRPVRRLRSLGAFYEPQVEPRCQGIGVVATGCVLHSLPQNARVSSAFDGGSGSALHDAAEEAAENICSSEDAAFSIGGPVEDHVAVDDMVVLVFGFDREIAEDGIDGSFWIFHDDRAVTKVVNGALHFRLAGGEKVAKVGLDIEDELGCFIWCTDDGALFLRLLRASRSSLAPSSSP